jgi:hypothetical protein
MAANQSGATSVRSVKGFDCPPDRLTILVVCPETKEVAWTSEEDFFPSVALNTGQAWESAANELIKKVSGLTLAKGKSSGILIMLWLRANANIRVRVNYIEFTLSK